MGNNNRFMDGLIIGAILGGAAVFLLGTKKGNKLLKIMTEEGWEGLEDLAKTLDEKQVVPKTVHKAETAVEDLGKRIEEKVEHKSNGVNHASPNPRRFFRRAKA